MKNFALMVVLLRQQVLAGQACLKYFTSHRAESRLPPVHFDYPRNGGGFSTFKISNLVYVSISQNNELIF